MTQQLIVIFHVLVAFAIIGLILIQQGKGADMGASFGSGASQTVMGSQGSGGVFLKVTALLSVIFFVTSFTLAVMAKDTFKGDDVEIPTLEQVKEIPTQQISTEIPSVEIPSVKKQTSSDEIPTVETTKQAAEDAVKETQTATEVPVQ